MKKFFKFFFGGGPGAITGYIIIYKYTPDKPKNLEEILFLVKVSVIAFLIKESISFIVYSLWKLKGLEIKEVVKKAMLYFSITLAITILNTISFYLSVMVLSWCNILLPITSVLSQAVINLAFTFITYKEVTKVFNGK